MPDAAQTRGSYALIDRLRADFPHVEIESCASGGGRIDFGILQRTQRVWLSDSNDALERLRIQHDAALFLATVSHRQSMSVRAIATPLVACWISVSARGSPPSATWGSRWIRASWMPARRGADRGHKHGGRPTATGCIGPIFCGLIVLMLR